MFTHPTVFVLGAGISKPFNFPLGKEMKDAICNGSIVDKNRMAELLQMSMGNSGRLGTVKRFMDAFRASDMYSIDTWLEANQSDKELLRVGKYAIAAIIMDAESSAISLGAPVERDWFAWLWNNMWTPNIEDLSKNTVSFVTFNYDRLFEWKLSQQIKNTYLSASPAQHQKAFEHLQTKIVHVHGELRVVGQPYFYGFGEVRFATLGNHYDSYYPDNMARYARCMQAYGNSINIVCENPTEDNVLIANAKALIQKEKCRLVFLGFSYDKRNILKLGLNDYAKSLGLYGKGKSPEVNLTNLPIIGTGMGIKRGERAEIETMFCDLIALAPDTMDAVEFCRSYLTI